MKEFTVDDGSYYALCIMCLKFLVDDQLLTCSCAYAPQTGRSASRAVEKDCFWDQMLDVTGSIPALGLIVVEGI